MKKNKVLVISIIFLCLLVIFLYLYNSHKKTTPVETPVTETEEYEEITIYSGATPLDSIFENIDISLNTEEIPSFLDSSSIPSCMQSTLVGAMFKDEISNEYKIIYSVNRATWIAFNYDETTMSENYGYIVSLKKETVEKLVKQIFKDVTIPEKFTTKYSYYGIEDFICKKDNCYYTYIPFGITGDVITGYETKTTIIDNIATLNYFYIQYGNSLTTNEEIGTITTNISLSNTHTSKELISLKEYTFYPETSPDSTIIFDTFSPYFESLPTYEYTFDENNVLISVKKLDN